MAAFFLGVFVADERQVLAVVEPRREGRECRPRLVGRREVLAVGVSERDLVPRGVVGFLVANAAHLEVLFGGADRVEQVGRRPEFGNVLVDRGVKPRGRTADDADSRRVRGHVGELVLERGDVRVREGSACHTHRYGRPAFIYGVGANRRHSMTGDSEDPNADVQYHLEVSGADVADTVLLPGNPERLEKIVAHWDDHEIRAHHREYRTATGTYEDTPISVTSTGIGSPSAAIAVEELARVGCETFIRVGSCGAIQADMDVGDLVISTGAVRQEGTSDEYVREDYPASADYEVVSALVAAAERLGYDYHTGITMSADSFYAGQGRPGYDEFEAAGADDLIDELVEANVKNIEMEASSIFTLANIYGLRAGAVCSVYANRQTGEFRTEGESRAAETATLATHLLARMDAIKREAGADRWHPGLSLE